MKLEPFTLTIKGNNASKIQKLINKLPRIKDLEIVYQSGSKGSKVTKEKRNSRHEIIIKAINKKPLQAYDIERIKNLLINGNSKNVSTRTINRDLLFLALKKKLVIERINSYKYVCAKNEKTISNYKKL